MVRLSQGARGRIAYFFLHESVHHRSELGKRMLHIQSNQTPCSPRKRSSESGGRRLGPRAFTLFFQNKITLRGECHILRRIKRLFSENGIQKKPAQLWCFCALFGNKLPEGILRMTSTLSRRGSENPMQLFDGNPLNPNRIVTTLKRCIPTLCESFALAPTTAEALPYGHGHRHGHRHGMAMAMDL